MKKGCAAWSYENLGWRDQGPEGEIVCKCVSYVGALPLYFATGKYYTLDEAKVYLHTFSTTLGFSICCFTAG
jgi:hypothetical protein